MSTDMINKRLKIISEIEGELNKLKTHYQESLENDPSYQKVQEEAKKMKETVKEKQEKITSSNTYKHIADEIKEKRQELKEQKEIIAQEFADYYRESGELEIEDHEGNVKRIKFSAKLVS